ncbi:hypothetical protein C2E23DRAFT_872203 [Lenzites betulinus]|nr:hypothetical protein C2E23DRAFT_872203 [Lenzites betulinus]
MSSPSYTVLPCGVLDTSHATDSIIVTGWVLDQRLEPQKVLEAWASLVNAWPILNARLRQDRKRLRWEYHIPVKPAASESFAKLDIPGPIEFCYRFARPSQTISCTVKENPQHLFLPHAPHDVDALLREDVPITHIHITTFDDATLVGLYVPHILSDGHGVAAIVRALTAILSGENPPPPLEHTDPFLSYSQAPLTAPAPYGWRVLSLIETVMIYTRALWEWAFDNDLENREVFFPASDVARIKGDAMKDIRREHGENTDIYVSSSDAILAFCLKCKHPPTASNAPLNVFYTAGLRNVLSLPGPFLHNAVCMVITPTLPVSAVSEMSLGALALHIRRTLESQTTPVAVETWLRWRLQNTRRKKAFFDPWRGQWDVVTNWREMRLMDVDFSGALPELRVRCLYVWGNGIQPIPLRNWIGIWADDPSGGIWMSGFFPRRVWEDKRGFGEFIDQQ